MTLGVHFAITDEQRKTLEGAADDAARIDYVKEVIEEAWEEEFTVESDKAWDALHRCLGEVSSDVYSLWPIPDKRGICVSIDDYGEYPLKLCVLGGEKLIAENKDYCIRLIEPHEVSDLVPALNEIDIVELSKRYFKYCEEVWPEFGQEDFDYSWEYFVEVRAFFRRMDGNGRSIIFTVAGA
ncbi:MAG: DUF1877 family protein [Alphaproteobacteria bacterium]|nr:DUF1877 family protein [Alphaproteobacteria bacterium]